MSANKSIGLNLYARYTADKNASRGTNVGLKLSDLSETVATMTRNRGTKWQEEISAA